MLPAARIAAPPTSLPPPTAAPRALTLPPARTARGQQLRLSAGVRAEQRHRADDIARLHDRGHGAAAVERLAFGDFDGLSRGENHGLARSRRRGEFLGDALGQQLAGVSARGGYDAVGAHGKRPATRACGKRAHNAFHRLGKAVESHVFSYDDEFALGENLHFVALAQTQRPTQFLGDDNSSEFVHSADYADIRHKQNPPFDADSFRKGGVIIRGGGKDFVRRFHYWLAYYGTKEKKTARSAAGTGGSGGSRSISRSMSQVKRFFLEDESSSSSKTTRLGSRDRGL